MWWLALTLAACKPPAPAVSGADWRPSPPADDDAIYFVLVDRFADGDMSNNGGVNPNDPQGWHGGDIQGVLDRIDYIHGLGVRTVWLSPVFDSREEPFGEWGAYHGYWVDSLDSIDPRFGSTDALRALSDALHERDMRLVLDVVYNHTSFDSPLLTAHPDWYHEAKPIVNWDDPIEAQTHQVHGLPDLDQSNPEVRDYLMNQTERWINELQVDGLRIDAVRHIHPDFFEDLANTLAGRFDGPVATIGEIFNGDRRSLVETWRQGSFQSVFDFPLYYALIDSGCRGKPAGRIAANLAYDRWEYAPGEWVTFLDNHDLPRLASECGQERVPLLLATQMTSRGRPMLTYGTESGLEGAEEPANRADMNFDQTPYAFAIRELLALRANSGALTKGTTQVIGLSDTSYLVIRRAAHETNALVGVNLGNHEVQHELPNWLPSDQWTSIHGTATLDGSTLTLPANSVHVLERTTPIRHERLPQRQTVHFQNTKDAPGGVLRLVGEGEPLGHWDPTAAPILPPEGLHLEFPSYAVLEYKLVREAKDGSFVWEDGDNRYLLVEPSSTPLSAEVRFAAPPNPE